MKNKICSRCKTGKEMYELDENSVQCPFIESVRNGKCNMFVPMPGEEKKKGFLQFFKRKYKNEP
ncbi:MAG: hypothetical protein E7473_07350 [Ruminococcaceae bacterium]|nr:hypothetical protein [Oscillospiraceae bacterium]